MNHEMITPAPSKNNWRTYLELSAFLGLILPPIGTILGPFIVWLIAKDNEAEVRKYGPAVLNFHISWTIWGLLSCGLGYIPYLVFCFIRLLKLSRNEEYEAPWTLNLIK